MSVKHPPIYSWEYEDDCRERISVCKSRWGLGWTVARMKPYHGSDYPTHAEALAAAFQLTKEDQ